MIYEFFIHILLVRFGFLVAAASYLILKELRKFCFNLLIFGLELQGVVNYSFPTVLICMVSLLICLVSLLICMVSLGGNRSVSNQQARIRFGSCPRDA
jgi:hypothetical protein